MVGHARLRIDFHPDGVLGVDVACELIGVRIMPWAPKVLNFDDLVSQALVLPAATKAKVKFRQNLAKADDF